MIARPTTEQLLNDCAREVRESIMPAISDPAALVRMEMLEQILASCAVRAAHEIAWIEEECAAMEAFTADVVVAFPDASRVAETLDAYRAGRRDALHLDDRVHNYDLAGRAFSEALDVAMQGRHPILAERARDLIVARKDREALTRPGFYFPGRS